MQKLRSVRMDAELFPLVDRAVKELKFWRSRKEFIEDAIRQFLLVNFT